MILEKTLVKLEYPQILEEVAEYAHSSLAKNKVLSSKPCASFSDAKKQLELTRQVFDLVRFDTSFYLTIDDVTDICKSARVLSTLSMGQLLTVMRQLRTARFLQKSLSVEYESIDTGLLRDMADLLYCDKYFEDEIDFAVLSDEEMNDKASSELYSIRKRVKSINADIKTKLGSYTRQGELSKYLQDSLVTMRGDRFVIPVKAEYKGYVNGIVHDQSASGSTLFIEPMAIVQLNNQLRIAISEEKAEIQRILDNFTQKVAPHVAELLKNQEIISNVDVLYSKVLYAEKHKATLPILTDNGTFCLKNARHPLIDAKKVVPVSIAIDDRTSIIVITGPNTGGKTVTEKTVGLLTCMALSGMFIPCTEGSSISYFDSIFCDIGDEQSISQNLSTFSSHITNVKEILEKANEKSLVLIDEVGAGTEPNEGVALALAITEKLLSLGAKCIITTHYGELKEYSLVANGIVNASMEFDTNTFAPTYKLVMGVPGSSNAISIAQKLGLAEDVIQNAKTKLSAEKVAFEKVLQNAESIRKQYQDSKEEVLLEKAELQQELAKAKRMNENLLEEREKLLKSSKQEAKRIVADATEDAKALLAEMKKLIDKGLIEEREIFEARSKIKTVQNRQYSQDEEEDGYVFTGDKVNLATLSIEDKVYSQKLGIDVTVTAIKGDKVSVKAGNISSVVSADDLYYCVVEKKQKSITKKQTAKVEINNSREQKSEINVIGQTVLEATENVDAFLDGASLCGLHKVWIIHGKGSGKLMQGLHKHFKNHPIIKSFRLGEYGEGEDGVTVVELK